MNIKIKELSSEELTKLLQLNYFKLGMELEPGSWEEKALVGEVRQYQGNIWVSAFNDMFSKYASGSLDISETLEPKFSGFFIAQLRHAFFDKIGTFKKRRPSAQPSRNTWLYRRSNRPATTGSVKLIGDLLAQSLHRLK